MTSKAEALDLESQLANLLLQVRASDNRVLWHQIGIVAHDTANALRSKDGEDIHTALGKTALPNTLTALLALALHEGSIPDDYYTTPTLELLRVGANLCMNHDTNRNALLEAGFPQAVTSLLEGYAEIVESPADSRPLALTIPHLKVIRNAVGVLLNACMGFDPIKFRLLSVEAVLTILKLANSIYPPGSWQYHTLKPESGADALTESWTLRSGISNWAWRAVTELRDVSDESLLKMRPEILPVLTPTLAAFTPSSTELTPVDLIKPDSELYYTLVRADFDALEETCSLVESLSLDVEDIRYSLARGYRNPAEHDGVLCLQSILNFIETGGYPPSWSACTTLGEAELLQLQKSFTICKAALVKSVVEVAGEDTNEEQLWDDSNGEAPGGEFVKTMVRWIKDFVSSAPAVGSDSLPRDDLVICASLSLGNLARREKHAVILLSSPHNMATVLVSPQLLGPSVDIKLKHGVLGLLKHMAQSSPLAAVHDHLLQANAVRHISMSGIWDEKADNMAEIVQLSAIGVVKHMCGANVENVFTLVLPEDDNSPTGLARIMALTRRSESVPIRSEGTRVLVNVVRRLWNDASVATKADSDKKQKKKHAAIRLMLTQEVANALALLVTRSGKYPLLINEGLVALSLLSTQRAGAPLVLKALEVSSASTETSPMAVSPTSSDALSSPSVVTPSSSTRGQLHLPETATDMLVAVLRNVDNPANFQVEVRVNVCSLLLQLEKQDLGAGLATVKRRVQPVLEQVVEDLKDVGSEGMEATLAAAAREVMKGWSGI
ncbi:hypothetical protein CYLTODRAFT_392703 [Cylindrobasidium torrendii FP15055 ss-10]|uniref:ARM repeat-containing protein n=1 Tax=Cylindrobasidium torrendii FP15055 ss-10 TaxID=1314674 RepID=A0A0D7BIA2_9AGAR|nr:hypothetical protein CYLTODRAFT_392703 [Cylindrobasidium torrendii FP15055 ss-10]